MNGLIIYAHPEPTSFTGALKDTAVKTLEASGHAVDVSDLYLERFDPVAGRHDFKSVFDPKRLHYQSEQEYASEKNSFAEDIAREQRKVKKADFFIFVFPLWWGGLPAILKGWIDRVLAYGVAYADGYRFDKGFFKGRRGILCLTTGGTEQRFSEDGVYGKIEDVLYPVQHCVLRYLGLEVLEPFVAYAAPRVGESTRKRYLIEWETRVREMVEDPVWQAKLHKIKETEEQPVIEKRGWERKR